MAEGTQNTTQEQEALIQDMLRTSNPTEIESTLTTNPIVHKGDGALPSPMVSKVISSAGYVWVWETRTYDKAPVLYYRLPQVLRQKREDGSYRFTTTDPGKLPVRGKVKCELHKDNPNRKHYDEMGFRYCPKENITNLHQLRLHMMGRHKQEWAAIEEERREKEREEDRALQRLLLTSQLAKGEQKKEESSKPPFVCNICNMDFGSQITLEKHKKTHK